PTPTPTPTLTPTPTPTLTPTPAGSFRFIALADSQGGPDIIAAISQSIVNKGLKPGFVIFPGDLCPDTNCFATNWKYQINGDVTGRTSNGIFDKTFATRGNHDTASVSGWQSAFNFAAVAARVGATNYVEQTSDMTYSFDYGNSHFIGIDMPGGPVGTITSSQITWLDNDLAAAESRGMTHAFLFWHGPIYYVDGHPSTPPSALISVLNKHPIVSAAFFGHEHVVTYTHIDSSRIPAITHPFEQFVSGSAGATPYTVTQSRTDYCLGGITCPTTAGYMSVDVSGNNFNVTFYSRDGTLDKLLTFSKYAATSTVSTPTFSPSAGIYANNQTVTISTQTAGATIHYTTDGTTPTETSTIYTAPVVVSSNTTIKAGAWKAGMNPSSISSAKYTIYVPVLYSITISPSSVSLSPGSTQQFAVSSKDQYGNPYSSKVTWVSGNTTVGTVNTAGLFTALNPGITTIKATSGQIYGTATVTVTAAGWNLVWSDEFDGYSIDASKWNLFSGAADGDTCFVPGAVTLSGGQAHFAIMRTPTTCIDYRNGKTVYHNYAGGGIGNYAGPVNGISLSSGRWETRARFPKGNGTSAYIALWPANDIWTAEVDFAEGIGSKTNQIEFAQHWNGNIADQSEGAILTNIDITQFHTYAVEMENGKLKWYVDGNLITTQTQHFSPTLMGFTVGSWAGTCTDTWPGCPSGTTLPVYLDVDYIRVYQRN
ncbi:MAG TPA: chitobiase/beta-hexosaminidase C-terminal domain-containing protein, partial [Candidatus Methanoperedens sp.]